MTLLVKGGVQNGPHPVGVSRSYPGSVLPCLTISFHSKSHRNGILSENTPDMSTNLRSNEEDGEDSD